MLSEMQWEIWPKRYLIDSSHNIHNQFSILTKGHIKIGRYSVESGREITLFMLGPGDGFSIMSLFGLLADNHFGMQGRTLEKVELLSAPVERWSEWMVENEQLRQSASRIASSYFTHLCDLASGLALDPVMTRLVHLLLRNVDWSTRSLNRIRHLSQEELANLVGTVRPVMGRLLSELRRDGAVELKDGELHVVDLQPLIDRADRNFVAQLMPK